MHYQQPSAYRAVKWSRRFGSFNAESPIDMKSKIVMPPPGNFQKADVYLRRRWKRVQYLSNVFWSRWRKEYVQTLQERVKWNNPRRNLQRGDLVLIADDRVPRNQWNMARVVDSRPDSKGQVRSVKVATATTTLERPIQKLVLVLENEENWGPGVYPS